MALKLKDRVKQVTTTTGTGTLTLSSSFPSYQTFNSALSDGDITYYTIQNNSQFEVGRGVFSGTTLTRDNVLSSSSGTAKINISASSNVFITYPADGSVYTSGTNRIITDVSGIIFPDGNTQTIAYTGHQDLSSYATTVFVNSVSGTLNTRITNVSGNLQTDIDSASGTLNTKINNVSGTLNTKITSSSGTLNTKIDNVSGNLQTGTNNVSGYLQPQITANAAASGYLQGQVTSNDTEILALQTSTGLLDTRVTTNTSNISLVSGIAVSKDNYQYWSVSDGSTLSNISSTDQVKYTGLGSVSVALESGSPNVVKISGVPGAYTWNVGVSGITDTITDTSTVTFTGLGRSHVLYDTSSNTVTISGDSSNIAAGSNTEVQFNDSGLLGGDSDLTWNKTSNTLAINGTLVATSKSFLIDHPTKENSKLQYACLEGPENGVYVRGFADSNIIELPEYWVKLIDENSITVSLTPKGYSQPNLFVDRSEDNKIYLRSDKQVSAYYIIYAVRKDIDPLEVEWAR